MKRQPSSPTVPSNVLDGVRQFPARAPKSSLQRRHAPAARRQVLDAPPQLVAPGDELMNMAEAAKYLRYDGKHPADAAYAFLRRHVTLYRRGTHCLVLKSAIDAHLVSHAQGGDQVARARAIQAGTR